MSEKIRVIRRVYESNMFIYEAEVDADKLPTTPEEFDELDWETQKEFWDDECEYKSECVREKDLNYEETFEILGEDNIIYHLKY